MKKILESKLFLVIITIVISITGSIIANTIISSKSVSYTNSKTNETTVEGSLNELFSAVDINGRLGTTDISNIGDGTVSGAINTLNTNINSSVSELNNKIASKTTIKYAFVTIAFTNGVSYRPVEVSNLGYVINLAPNASDWSCNFSYVNGLPGVRIILYDQNGDPLNFTGNQQFIVWYV